MSTVIFRLWHLWLTHLHDTYIIRIWPYSSINLLFLVHLSTFTHPDTQHTVCIFMEVILQCVSFLFLEDTHTHTYSLCWSLLFNSRPFILQWWSNSLFSSVFIKLLVIVMDDEIAWDIFWIFWGEIHGLNMAYCLQSHSFPH